MKRSGFKRKPTKPMKRTKMRRKSKSPQKVLEDKIWELCRQITFLKHGRNCYTCPQVNLVGRNLQCGHMIPKGSVGVFLKYDLRILRPQCYDCNINNGGMGAEFYRKMMVEIGPTAMNEIVLDKQVTVHAMDHYKKLLEKYQDNWSELIK